jgi:predicted transcriptional regulator
LNRTHLRKELVMKNRPLGVHLITDLTNYVWSRLSYTLFVRTEKTLWEPTRLKIENRLAVLATRRYS